MSIRVPYNDEQRRLLLNLAQYYDAWLLAEREVRQLGRLNWKRISGHKYLYEIFDSKGNGRSLGPRSAENDARYERHRRQREDALARRAGARDRLAESGRMYRALRLGMLSSEAAAILREADCRGLLDTRFMVVGTNAMIAYEIEAQSRFATPLDETADFDVAWVGTNTTLSLVGNDSDAPVFEMLKAVDDTFTVNTGRKFQARNAKAYEVELLAAPSVVASLPKGEKLHPVPLPEQEWLLRGKRVDRIVCARDGFAARVVAPDPRWFALHKLWLSEKKNRTRLKRPKDRAQGEALLQTIAETMPHYPLDKRFIKQLPAELSVYLDRA